MAAAPATDVRGLRLGAPGADDSQRSPDEIRIIKQMASEEVELFLRTNGIDDAAARELRNESPYVAHAVIDRGPLKACVNPSGALVARIRDAKRGILTGAAGRYGGAPMHAPLDPNASDLDKFLAENRIDQAGIASLRSETPEVQRAVMSRGPLVNTTNPSASLMARIRHVKQEAQSAGGTPGAFVSQAPCTNEALPVVTPPPPPPPAPAAPPAPPPPPPPSTFALENQQWCNSGATISKVDDSHLADEALKAIQKLQGTAHGQVPHVPVATVSQPTITKPDDAQLQEEALKAIQALNSAVY